MFANSSSSITNVRGKVHVFIDFGLYKKPRKLIEFFKMFGLPNCLGQKWLLIRMVNCQWLNVEFV